MEIRVERRFSLVVCVLGLISLVLVGRCGTAEADDLALAGKKLKLVVGATAGGGNDIYGRILTRYITKHIPGSPTILVVNMPGASSMKAAHYFANIAPRDGTELLEIVQALPLVQAFGQANITFDLAAFHWVGNMTDSPVVFLTWRGSAVHDLESAKREEAIFGSTTTGALFSMMPLMMNHVVGTKFKVINGYDSGRDIELATERGEIAGFGGSTWSSLAISQPQWLREKKVNILAQAGLQKAPALMDVPLLTDLASTEEDRAVLLFYSGVVAFARAFALGPDVPGELVAIWRKAFDATMKDPAFVAEAAKMKLDVNPISGEALQEIITRTVHADKELIARAERAIADTGASGNSSR